VFDFDWSDLLSLQALFAGGGWGVSSIMAIAGLHLAKPHRGRSTALLIVCALVFIAALIEGAREHKDARIAQEQQNKIADGITALQSKLNEQNREIQSLKDQFADLHLERHLSEQQKNDLRKYLVGFAEPSAPDIIIAFIKGDVEAGQYAKEFLEFFNSIGINSSGSGNSMDLMAGDRHRPLAWQAYSTNIRNIELATSDDYLPERAEIFIRSLRSAGFVVSGAEKVGGLAPHQFAMIVGLK
jgi:hypothetical protein